MKSIIAIIVASLALVACGKKDETVADQATATVGAPASTPAPAPVVEPVKVEEAKTEEVKK